MLTQVLAMLSSHPFSFPPITVSPLSLVPYTSLFSPFSFVPIHYLFVLFQLVSLILLSIFVCVHVHRYVLVNAYVWGMRVKAR